MVDPFDKGLTIGPVEAEARTHLHFGGSDVTAGQCADTARVEVEGEDGTVWSGSANAADVSALRINSVDVAQQVTRSVDDVAGVLVDRARPVAHLPGPVVGGEMLGA